MNEHETPRTSTSRNDIAWVVVMIAFAAVSVFCVVAAVRVLLA